VLSVIAAAGIVPCIGFFKYSYDAITELVLKRDEIDVSERLIHRHDRILEYYKDLHSPKTAKGPIADQRISVRWDRYDSDTLPREHWIAITATPCHDWYNPFSKCLRRIPRRSSTPVKMMGVASTEDAEENWEHSWKECTPTSFQLLWNRPPDGHMEP
jgi:hypothetical protein